MNAQPATHFDSMLEKVARHFSADGMNICMDTDYGIELSIIDPWDTGAGIDIFAGGGGDHGELDITLYRCGRARTSRTVYNPTAQRVIEAVEEVAAAENYTISYSNFS